MKRTNCRSATWRSGGTALAAAMVLMVGPAARAELELDFFLPPEQFQTLMETKSQFVLLFNAGLSDNDNPPAPDPQTPFSVSFSWRLVQSGTPGAFASNFDRSSLAGLEGVPEGTPLWSFSFGLSTGFTTDANGEYDGVQNLELFLQGEHLDGPSDNDIDPNSLPDIKSDPVAAGIGDTIIIKSVDNVETHPHTIGVDGIDRYGFSARFEVTDDITGPLNPPDFLVGPPSVLIFGEHRHPLAFAIPNAAPRQTGVTTGASESFAFYDADSNSLKVSAGLIDTAQSRPVAPCGGCRSGALPGPALAGTASMVDPEFASDPVLGSFIFIDSPAGFDAVSYLGFDAVRGLHVFSGGTLEIEPFGDGEFTFNATFEEMLYDNVSGNFFALLDTVNYTDRLNSPPSEFLDQFTDAHLFGGDPTSRGIMFTFNMPRLAEATDGFTKTFFPTEPLGMYLTGVLIPEPASMVLLVLACGLLFHRRFP